MFVVSVGALMAGEEDEKKNFPIQEEGDHSNVKVAKKKEPIEHDDAVENIDVPLESSANQDVRPLQHQNYSPSNYLNLPLSPRGLERSEHSNSQVFSSATRLENTSPNPITQNQYSEREEDLLKPSLPPEIIFWNTIDGPDEKKDWKKVKKELDTFIGGTCVDGQKINERNYIGKFITRMFDCEVGIREPQSCYKIDLERMIAYFGPFNLDSDGCFRNIFDIMKKSTVKRERDGKTWLESYFGGEMKKVESEKRLKDPDVLDGMFIVRFSESSPDNGTFSLDIKNRQQIKHYAIERKDGSNELYINEDTSFNTIPELVKHYRDFSLDPDAYVLCTNPCPGLPFNEICTPYKNLGKRNMNKQPARRPGPNARTGVNAVGRGQFMEGGRGR